MNETAIQQTFQLCSYLLSYPDLEFTESFPEIEEALELLPESDCRAELRSFYEKSRVLKPQEMINAYVNTFDFGKKTNLYVTYMTNGEQRERGMDLLFLKNYYKLNGFDLTDRELPDYLPVMLEFAGQTDAETIRPVFERYIANIREIENGLARENNFYAHILKAVLLALKETGITKAARRSEEICSNNFYG